MRANDAGPGALAALTVAVMVVIVGATEATRSDWESYTFRAGSAEPSFAVTGRLAETGPWELVLQTQVEDDPWVEIDLRRERVVTRLRLVPGTPCCGRPRALRLSAAWVLELAGEDRAFEEVARRPSLSAGERWEVALENRRARHVRVRRLGKTALFFQTLEIE